MTNHTTWCAGGHLCNLSEHRAHPIAIHPTGALTRVRDHTGRDHVEIRLRLPLPANETAARHRLAALLAELANIARQRP